MKTPLIVLALFGISELAQASDVPGIPAEDIQPRWLAVVSIPQSNLVVSFRPLLSDNHAIPVVPATNFPADRPILVGYSSTTAAVYNLLMLRPEYGYRVSATSESGVLMEKTWKGREYGAKCDEVKGYLERAIDTSRGSPGFHWHFATQPETEDEFHLSQQLSAPSELFRMDKPGKYTVRIEAQCLCRPFPPRTTNFYVVRFPPVLLPVIKEGKK
jgi:hypothetical protein